jgi:hypothetical protein
VKNLLTRESHTFDDRGCRDWARKLRIETKLLRQNGLCHWSFAHADLPEPTGTHLLTLCAGAIPKLEIIWELVL